MMRFMWAALVAALIGCGGAEGPKAEMTADEARARALKVIPEGAVKEVVKHPEPGIVHWMVVLGMPTGGEIAVEFDASNGELDEIEAEKGPFDYEVAPRADVMKLSEAKAKAFAVKAGNVEVWEFYNRENEWEFYIRDKDARLWEIIMTATDGAVKKVVQKDTPD
ncbi:MAG: PepSY domain-containing protein [Deltaproteobacteria bacterium]|nr:PepSY domain-containing protein [Deltaproteobacteria bacterium]